LNPSDQHPLRISVFGLGYVGAVTAACLAEQGHRAIGVDVRKAKVDLINAGNSPIVESGIERLILEQVRAGRLSATMDPRSAVLGSDLSIVCVGTPSLADGGINSQFVETVCGQLGAALAEKNEYHVVVVRSTVLPGITRGTLIPMLERHSRRRAGEGFGVCFNPEFLREATAIDDFKQPSKTVIGQLDARSGDAVAAIYRDVSGPVIRTSIETAEIAKYADNAWHALKICFANEMGTLSKAAGVDSHEVMRIFCQDTKLNLSSYYLKPGFSFGGSCLPKDVRALTAMARRQNLDTPLLDSILPSNDAHLARALGIIRATGVKCVGILGVTFKAGTDDVRESPAITLLRHLRAEGIEVSLFDEETSLSRVMGENRQYLLAHVPEFEEMSAPDAQTLAEKVDVLVVTQNTPAYRSAVRNRRKGQIVIDLVHLDGQSPQPDYHVLC
jgi:GDP-mannose 6-dehydrogenase